ncbi:MAG TPA: isoprenylcysteine carboxylmethyltransferase family protein [Clostridia bacterium]
MRDFTGQGLFYVIIQAIICLSVFSLFVAIFVDFALYGKNEKVQKEKKSVVETGTMTLFFILFYVILRSGTGVIPIKSNLGKELIMIFGTMLIVVGCIANIHGRLSLGKNWANQIKIYEEQTLVVTGMYKIVRHPLYASIILMFIGGCLVYRNVLAFISVFAVFVPFMTYRARQEERMLVHRFKEYGEYKEKTGMFFPKISRSNK